MLLMLQFQDNVNLKNGILRGKYTFIFISTHLLFFIGTPTFATFMQDKEMQQEEAVSFASLVATRRPRNMKDGVLVHASGNKENGNWRPLAQPTAWQHLHQRSLEAMA
jgi:hypothetical protein